MRVLVTGASGFLGTRLVEQLQASGHSVDVVKRNPSAGRGALQSPAAWQVAWPDGLSQIDYSGYSAVVHLAAPRAAPRSGETEAAQHVAAIERLIDGIRRTNHECVVIFASSQSATPSARSAYGRGKWMCERALRSSGVRYVIVRLGLVVSQGDLRGLYGGLMRIVTMTPLVPVPHSKRLLVQPVFIDDAVRAIEAILHGVNEHVRTVVGVAGRPRSLPCLIQDACWEESLYRVVLRIPLSISVLLLRIVSFLCPWLPASHEKLLALSNSIAIDPTDCQHRLGVTMREFGRPAPGWSMADRRRWEARLLTRQMFGTEPTARMVERYLHAHEVLPHISSGPFADLSEVSQSGLVLEAMERSARGPGSALSGKFLVLSYLAEMEPKFGCRFASVRTNRVRAWASLASWVPISLAMMVFGSLMHRAVLRRRQDH